MYFKDYKFLICDFDGVLTDNKVYVSEKGTETVLCSRSDGIGFRVFEQNGIIPIILSSEISPVVIQRAKKLSVKCYNNIKSKRTFLLENNNIITSDKKGNIIVFSIEKKNIISKFNFYKKQFKKKNKKLNLIVENNIIYTSKTLITPTLAHRHKIIRLHP